MGTSRDGVWHRIRTEVTTDAQSEPALTSFLHTNVLAHQRLEDALSFILAHKLGSATITSLSLRELVAKAFAVDIHPGARIGKGVMFDHATSVVIGETAVIENDQTLNQQTLKADLRQF